MRFAAWLRRHTRRPPTIADLIRAASAAPCEPRRPRTPRPDRDPVRMTPAQRRQLLTEIPVRPYDRTRTPDRSACPAIRWAGEEEDVA